MKDGANDEAGSRAIEAIQTIEAIEADAAAEAGVPFLRLAADYFAATRGGEGRVSTALSPEAIAGRFDEPLPRLGRPLAEVAERVGRDVIAEANRLYHPMAIGHQVAPPLPAAVWSDVVTAALNQSTAVWEMSPVATVLEHRVVGWLAELAGFGEAAGGTFTSGGTEATFAALLAARARLLPDVWTDGVGGKDGPPPVVIAGEHAHYAVARAVGEMGLGTRNLVTVPSRDWRMDVAALAGALAGLRDEGRPVMAVVATAGSTATGSFDDLERIADLCDRHDVWLHVDGAHGASALLSAAHRDRLRGVARARSLAWDPHKMMLLPLAAGVVLVRDREDLERAFAQRAPYLFQAPVDEEAEAAAAPRAPVWDQGVRSFQCSRRADVVKLWVAFQRYGADGIGALYAHLCDTAQRLHDRLRRHARFEVLHVPESNILCFRWHGGLDAAALTEAALDALNLRLRERYNAAGDGWITTTLLGGRRVLRVTVMNPRTDDAHLDRLVAGLDATGRGLLAEA